MSECIKRLPDENRLPECNHKACGKPVKYSCGGLCEDHAAESWVKFHGRDQSVDTLNSKE